jgi:plasmid stabilization system protein ParE
MPRLRYADGALADIERPYRFLAAKNPDAAQRAVAAILEQIEILERHPQLAPEIDDDPDYRDWSIRFGKSGYVARFRVDEDIDEIVILAIRHGKETGSED